MRVFHDDVRLPPAGWVWARTNAQAIALLEGGHVAEISLDHDLGLEHLDPNADIEVMAFAGRSQDGSGLDLVHWMIENDKVPPIVWVHSWNPDGAANMAAALNRHGYDCYIAPFKAS